MPRTSGSSPWLSWVLAAEMPIETGRPVRSVQDSLGVGQSAGQTASGGTTDILTVTR